MPTNTAVPTDTPVPTNTPAPTSTPVPTATITPTPGYPPNAYERLSALRSYHLQYAVKGEGFESTLSGDEATPNYHITMTLPFGASLELYFVNGRYVSSVAGSPFVDTGANPPPQAAALEAAEQFARGWFAHPDGATFKGLETANGVRANHYVLTWKAGRQVVLGGISSTTYDPATGDVWLDAASGAIVKANFSMRVSTGGGPSTLVVNVDVTNINRPLTITPPAAAKAPGG